MFCPHCGRTLPDDTAFCPGCSKPLAGTPSAPFPAVRPTLTPRLRGTLAPPSESAPAPPTASVSYPAAGTSVSAFRDDVPYNDPLFDAAVRTPPKKNGSRTALIAAAAVLFAVLCGLIAFLLLHTNRSATVTGRVLDAQTGKPLSGVTIQILDAETDRVKKHAKSDDDGSFSARVPTGDVTVTLSLDAYAETSWQLSALEKGKTYDLGDCMLQPLATPDIYEGEAPPAVQPTPAQQPTPAPAPQPTTQPTDEPPSSAPVAASFLGKRLSDVTAQFGSSYDLWDFEGGKYCSFSGPGVSFGFSSEYTPADDPIITSIYAVNETYPLMNGIHANMTYPQLEAELQKKGVQPFTELEDIDSNFACVFTHPDYPAATCSYNWDTQTRDPDSGYPTYVLISIQN